MSSSDSDNSIKKKIPAKRATRLTSQGGTLYQLDPSGKKPISQQQKISEASCSTDESPMSEDSEKLLNELKLILLSQDNNDKKAKTLLNIVENKIDAIEYTNQLQTNSLTEDLENKDLTIANLESQIEILQEMANEIHLKDMIQSIPSFTGKIDELDTFINTCDVYNELVEQNQKANLLRIIKGKIAGEALHKASPINDLNTWDNLKRRLIERIRRPVTYEFAHTDISSILQNANESIEAYGKRTKEKLRKLNEASRSLVTGDDQLPALRTANEKLAIAKFVQNLRNDTTRVLTSAQTKDTLDETIALAMQKELGEKSRNFKNMCQYCSSKNHESRDCFKKS